MAMKSVGVTPAPAGSSSAPIEDSPDALSRQAERPRRHVAKLIDREIEHVRPQRSSRVRVEELMPLRQRP
jgi:hypothetical protein